jgi:hypothetical protein
MYLLYVVPIQGKDAEIAHMKYVTQQFIDLKSDIDSLIINERVNVPIARSFELGTLASTGQGALSIVPIQGFIEAAGTLLVNEQMDTLTVQGVFKTVTPPLIVDQFVDPPANADIPAQWVDGEHLYINYPGIQSVNNTINGTIHHLNYSYTTVSNQTNVTITKEKYGKFVIHPEAKYDIETKYDVDLSAYPDPRVFNKNIISWVNNTTHSPGPNTTDYVAIKEQTDIIFDFYNWTEQTQYDVIQYRRTLQENATNQSHIFDLSKINEIMTTDPKMLEFNLDSGLSNGMGEPTWNHIIEADQPLGSLQYWSQNRYWINQELLYEMGGLFLKQNEGVSIMLIPSLAVTPVDTADELGPNIKTSLVGVSITDTNDVSGSKTAQVFAKIDSVVKNQISDNQGAEILPYTMISGEPNAKYVIITFKPQRTDDSITTNLWKRAYDQVYVITQKTMSDRQMTIDPAHKMLTLYDSDPLSASLIIGNDVWEHLSGIGTNNLEDYVARLNACAADETPDHSGPGHAGCTAGVPLRPFFFDYSKARVSLVIQSGAL